MSKAMRNSGRVGLLALIGIGLIGALVGVRLVAHAQTAPTLAPDRQPPSSDAAELQRFQIGPIDGLTSGWHLAPPATAIPLGTIVQFYQPAPSNATVIWTGANEVARDNQGSTAVCPLFELGTFNVHVDVSQDMNKWQSNESILRSVDIQAGQITVSPVQVWLDPIEIDESLPQDELNELTMSYFFGYSIAALRDLGSGQYRTSVRRLVSMDVEVHPASFAPVMEWRYDGQPVPPPPPPSAAGPMAPDLGMGPSATTQFAEVGNHTIRVGPLFNSQEIKLETYRVTITSHVSGDIVEEGEPVLFIAETDPPGYEDEITWLSSTKYGTAEPILGEGPIFIAEFNDTVGPHPDGGLWQWLGVKADNFLFGQDQKVIDLEICLNPDPDICNGVPVDGWCDYELGLDTPLFCSPQPVLPTQICIACKVPGICPIAGNAIVRIVNDGSSPTCTMTLSQRTTVCAPCTKAKRFIVVNQ